MHRACCQSDDRCGGTLISGARHPLPPPRSQSTLVNPPILLLHGALGSRAHLAPLASRIAPDDMVHLPERAGHGPTPPPPELLRVESLAADVLRA